MFGDNLERELVFLDYKNIDLKKSQNLHFSMGVGPWFWSKILNFFILCLGRIEMFGDLSI